jgi:glycosyltransferase involved in cell wall biosynthesis
MVLTAHPRAYETRSCDLLRDVPKEVKVERSFALDAARHLAVFGRYPSVLARPDRWLAWKWGAVPAGMRLIREHHPAVIWSTYPIATAHMIGAELHYRTGLPWIADFRDPMAQPDYPSDPDTWRSFKCIEERAVRAAARCVFVTPSAAQIYRDRYPEADRSCFVVIENGYDEESFGAAEIAAARKGPLNPGCVTLLHSGIVYPAERDPTHFFAALSELKRQGLIGRDPVRVRFRAPVHDELLRELTARHGLGDLIEVLPPIPYREALEEMLRADGLLVMQAANCNAQIPAKVYEYLRAKRPILGLADPAGDTAQLLRRAGLDTFVRLESADEIRGAVTRFLGALRSGTGRLPTPKFVSDASRRSRSFELARLLNHVVHGRAP